MRRKVPKYLSEEQIEKFFSNIHSNEEDVRIAFLLMYKPMLRVSEVVSLRVRDINLREGFLTVYSGKGGVDRVVPLTTDVLRALEDHIRGKEPGDLVVTHKGKPMDRYYLDRMAKRIAKRAGLTEDVLGFKMSCHKLRHSGARMWVKAGIRLNVLQNMMGHSDLSITSIYLNLFPEDAIGEIRKLEGRLGREAF